MKLKRLNRLRDCSVMIVEIGQLSEWSDDLWIFCVLIENFLIDFFPHQSIYSHTMLWTDVRRCTSFLQPFLSPLDETWMLL